MCGLYLYLETLAEGLQRLPGSLPESWGSSRVPRPAPPLTRVPLSPQVQLDNLPGMSLMAGKALSSARMSDAVLSQSSLMASQQLHDRESEGKELPGLQAWRGRRGGLFRALEGCPGCGECVLMEGSSLGAAVGRSLGWRER